jgi:hypothetical protein
VVVKGDEQNEKHERIIRKATKRRSATIIMCCKYMEYKMNWTRYKKYIKYTEKTFLPKWLEITSSSIFPAI